MSIPFFSIITICRNEEQRIHLTCDSVVAQKFTNYEWIIQDGQSTDNTLNIINTYKEHITYFSSEKDEYGIYNAMNKGIKKATGQYLIFLNGGDHLLNDSILQQVYEFIVNDNYKHKIYFGSIMYVNPIDNTSYTLKNKYLRRKSINKRFLYHDTFEHPATFIERSLFEVYGLYDDIHYRFAADKEWFVKTIKEKNIYMNMTISIFDLTGSIYRGSIVTLAKIEQDELRKIKNTYYNKYIILYFEIYFYLISRFLKWIKDFISEFVLLCKSFFISIKNAKIKDYPFIIKNHLKQLIQIVKIYREYLKGIIQEFCRYFKDIQKK